MLGDIRLHTHFDKGDIKMQLGRGNPDNILLFNSLSKSGHMGWDKSMFYGLDANDILVHLRVQR